MGHARLSPSAASRWCACPGSLGLIETRNIPDKSGMAAEEGTAAHELLETCLLGDVYDPIVYAGKMFNVGGDLLPEGFVADDDMVDAVKIATDYVKSRMTEGTQLFAERKIDPGSFFGRDDCKGTADITLIDAIRISILDYKHGKGILVEVKDNLQGLLYGIGVLADLAPEQRLLIKEVEIGIIQPRATHRDGPIRTMVYSVEAMYAWAQWFATKASATDQPDAALVPGSSQCKFCAVKKSRGGCPALRDKTLATFQVKDVMDLESKVLRDPKSLTPAERKLILDNAEIIEQFIKAVKGSAQEDLMNGIAVEGQKLVRGKMGNRKWNTDQDKIIKRLSSSFGLKKNEVTKDAPLLGIEAILKLTKKSEKYSDAKFKSLEGCIDRPEGKLTMAPESDPRPTASSQRAIDAFKDIKL